MINRVISIALAAAITTAGAAAADRAALRLAGAAGNVLVLDPAPDADWEVMQYGDLVEIRFPDTSFEIALPDLQPAGRIAEISSEIAGRHTFLRMVTRCACDVSISDGSVGGLVIRVLSEIETAETSAMAGATVSAPLPRNRPPHLVSEVPGTIGASAVVAEIDADQARAHLMRQLLRAAEAGLVEMDPPHEQQTVMDAAEVDVPSHTTGRRDLAAATTQSIPPLDDNGARRVEPDDHHDPSNAQAQHSFTHAGEDVSSMAGARRDGSATGRQSGAQASLLAGCAPPGALSLPAPKLDGQYADQVAELRGVIVGEFDKPQQEAAVELAKVYLVGGFGVEAAAIVRRFAHDHELAGLLTDISMLVEDRPVDSSATVMRPDCVGEQAMWRSLAMALVEEGAGAVSAEMAAGRSLERLPDTLRGMVAARIGLAAAEVGEWEAARRMEALIGRSKPAPGARTGPARILSARLAEWHGEKKQALRLLEQAALEDPLSAEAANLSRARMAVDNDGVPTPKVADLIANLAGLARNGSTRDIAAEATVYEARLASTPFGKAHAIELLSHGLATDRLTDEEFASAIGLVAAQPGSASDTPLAMLYLTDAEAFVPAMRDPAVRRIVVRSLIEVGLPAQAHELIADDDGADVDLLAGLARGLVDAGDQRAAMDILARLPDSDRKRQILGTALLAAGRSREAVDALETAAGPHSEFIAERQFLETRLQAALAEQDLEAALLTGLDLLAVNPDPELAENVSMIALQTGRRAVPDIAATVLRTAAPLRLEALSLLFQEAGMDTASGDAARTDEWISNLDSEIQVMERLLNDG